MLIESGDLIPVKRLAVEIPWTKRKTQIMGCLHFGAVDFQTHVYDTNVGDIAPLSTYFNPTKWSEHDLNQRFGKKANIEQISASSSNGSGGHPNASTSSGFIAKSANKAKSLIPRLLIINNSLKVNEKAEESLNVWESPAVSSGLKRKAVDNVERQLGAKIIKGSAQLNEKAFVSVKPPPLCPNEPANSVASALLKMELMRCPESKELLAFFGMTADQPPPPLPEIKGDSGSCNFSRPCSSMSSGSRPASSLGSSRPPSSLASSRPPSSLGQSRPPSSLSVNSDPFRRSSSISDTHDIWANGSDSGASNNHGWAAVGRKISKSISDFDFSSNTGYPDYSSLWKVSDEATAAAVTPKGEAGVLPAISKNLSALSDRTPSFLSPWTNPRDPVKSDADKFAGDEIYQMLNERSPLKIHDFDLDQLALSEINSPFEIRELNFDFPLLPLTDDHQDM